MGASAVSRGAGDLLFVHCVLALAICLALSGCASYLPRSVQEVGFLNRAETQSQGGLTVTVGVPSAEESAALIGVPLARRGIQPVWVRVENNTERDYLLLTAGIDPDYFSPQEVAWMHRYTLRSQANRVMTEFFHDRSIPHR
jgi:hypothetical protein